MKVSEIAAALGLVARTGGDQTKTVTGAYCSDMLSDVMSRAREGHIWLTIQGHQNVAAVATLTNVAAVVITGDRQPSEELLQRSEQESLAVFTTLLSTYEVAGRIYELLSGA